MPVPGEPSATVTLKSGIEGMLKRMVPEVKEVVSETTAYPLCAPLLLSPTCRAPHLHMICVSAPAAMRVYRFRR